MPAHQRRTRSVARQALGGRIGTGLRWVPDMQGWRRSAPVCRTRWNGGSPAADALGCWVAAQRAGLRTGRDGGSPAVDALGSPAADAVPDRPGWRRSATGCQTRRNGRSPAADALGCWAATQRSGFRTGRRCSPTATAITEMVVSGFRNKPLYFTSGKFCNYN